jgi:hypothetical protein
LSTLATVIFRMKDLCDQADPQGLHRLSFATATDVAGLACWSAAQVPPSRLRRELNLRNLRMGSLPGGGAETAGLEIRSPGRSAFLAAAL